MVTTVAPIQQALVQALRANAVLKAALTGGIHEGVAPQGSTYPWLVYQLHYAPYDFAWGSVLITAGLDVFVFHTDQVEARNLDQLVMTTLHDAQLAVSGQSTLFCRRTQDLQSVTLDDQGRKVYQVGGIFEIWTDQSLG